MNQPVINMIHVPIINHDLPIINVTIFDWDDTLLCSTFLSSIGYKLDTQMDHYMIEQLKIHEELIIGIFKQAITYGPVFIITNAETGWVELSSEKFIPSIIPMLQQIKVISARSEYEKQYPNDPFKWKCCAIDSVIGHLLSDITINKNIMSFGDSHIERNALFSVTKEKLQTLTKSLKFAEHPSIEQLKAQLNCLNNAFNSIQEHTVSHLDLQLTISQNDTINTT